MNSREAVKSISAVSAMLPLSAESNCQSISKLSARSVQPSLVPTNPHERRTNGAEAPIASQMFDLCPISTL